MTRRRALVLFVLVVLTPLLPAQAINSFGSMPEWIRLLAVVPGVPLIYLGEQEGTLYASIGVPALAAGIGLSSWFLAGDKGSEDFWKRDIGLLTTSIGESFSAYSLWAYSRDTSDAGGAPSLRTGRESYLQLLTAPFNPVAVFDYRILPVVGLEVAAFLSPDTISTMGSYFSKSSAEFMGFNMPASLALMSEIAYAMVTNLFVAVTEETVFRGVGLEEFGPLVTSIAFGAVHATNLLFEQQINGQAILKVAIQTALAGVAGYYLAMTTINNGYDMRTAIAYHYWHNVVAMVASFLLENGRSASPQVLPGKPNLSLQMSPAGPGIAFTVPLGE
jgi:membrane protease YdiL (CAAX protease family)